LKWLHVAWYTYEVSWRLIQAFKQILRFYLRNLWGSNVGITDRKDLWCRRSDGLGWHDIHTRHHKDCSVIQELIGGELQTHRQHGDLISLLLFYFYFFKVRKVG
jgi:hypothetical protein